MKIQIEILFKKCGISNQPNVCIFDDPCLSKFGTPAGRVRIPETICRTFVCVPMAPLNNSRSRCPSCHLSCFASRWQRVWFARFYIVCKEVPLGTPESPPIVSGVSDMHSSDCPNVEETRNPMQTFSRKKCTHFFPTNVPSAFPSEIPKCVSYNITYQSTVCFVRQFFPIICLVLKRDNGSVIGVIDVLLDLIRL